MTSVGLWGAKRRLPVCCRPRAFILIPLFGSGHETRTQQTLERDQETRAQQTLRGEPDAAELRFVRKQ
jgi:hypothetical protein